MPEQTPPLDTWAVLELFGHKKLAGKLTEQTFGTAAMFRLDVPETEQPEGRKTPAYTKLVGVSSVYAITPCTEEVARAVAHQVERYNDPIPVSLPASRQLAAVAPTDQAEFDVEDPEDDWGPEE